MKGLMMLVALSALVSMAASQTVWPKPQQQSSTSTVLSLDPATFTFESTGHNSDILSAAFERYMSLCFFKYPWQPARARTAPRRDAADAVTTMEVKVLTDDVTLTLSTNESYTLDVAASTSSITAVSVFGALRALETFSQLVVPSWNGVATTYAINETSIIDFPRFQHRGFLVDSSRHFLPLGVLFQFLDAMAYNKYNVLHWHIVDDQSFPFVSEAWPNLSEEGAYDPVHQIYSQEDVQRVIEYGRERGIRIVPEFDSPGHTQSWGMGYPQVLTPCYGVDGQPNGDLYAMYPIANFTYEFVYKLFHEVHNTFPDDYLHIGGDEVSFDCWASNPDIREFMKQAGYGTDYAMLEQYYETRVLEICDHIGLDYIVWQEVFDNGLKLSPSTVVEVWKDSPTSWEDEMSAVTGSGFRAILSTPWYLNYISYGKDWPTYYEVEPLAFNGSDAQKALVMGGEACMWGEYVDGTNLISRTWPRASAVGERLWSAANVTNVDDATNRIEELRCKLIKRGLSAEEPNGPGWCDIEFDPPYSPPWASAIE